MIYIVLIVLLILFIVFMTLGNLFTERALNMKSVTSRGNRTLTKNTQVYEYPPYAPGIYCQDMTSWVLNESNYRNVFIRNDGLSLHAIYIENPNSHKYVLNCHGYGSRAVNSGPFLHKFYLEGFNVLAPDSRGHGESEGTYTTMGYLERFDILKWIAYIIDNDAEAQIVLYGISMGAATVMYTVGEKLPENVKCAIEDCGYSSLMKQYRYECSHTFHIPSFPLLQFSNLASIVKLKFNFNKADTRLTLNRCKVPMLFIHGTADTFVPFDNLQINYDACRSEKEMLVVESATHARSSSFEPERYWNTVFQFIDKHINA